MTSNRPDAPPAAPHKRNPKGLTGRQRSPAAAQGDSVAGRLDWFLRNLDLLLDTVEQERAGKTVRIYFDTAHAVSAILGLQDFYGGHEGKFNRWVFEQPHTLVSCLAASEWLGEIRLLPSHQAEFLAKLELDFGVGVPRDPKGMAKSFLRDVGLPADLVMRPLNRMSNDEILELVRR